MKFEPEKIATDFLEIASEQRMKIILILLEQKLNLSQTAKKLDATVSEVHRNFNRLLDSGIVLKDADGNYELSLYGKTLCDQIPSILFVSQNKKFFKEHNFGSLPTKFIQRLGALNDSQHISGFVVILEKWKEIHNNAKKYIYNILVEVPYSKDVTEILSSKLKEGVEIHSIFSEEAIIPHQRSEVFEKENFQKHIKDDILQRKMNKNISIVTALNEKEACVIFPKQDGKSDMSEMFYSSDPLFHEWCVDFFNDSWNKSTSFQESKLK